MKIWEGFVVIDKDQTRNRLKNDLEVFGLDDEGYESLIEKEKDLDRFNIFVIEK